MVKDFLKFLREFNIVTLAVGFVMGTASTALVTSFVKDMLMPTIQPLLSADSWQQAALHIGPARIAYGSFLAELINFLILALIIFVVAKKILKIEVPVKK
jgi:large conductance mechanosensitive channel